MRTAYERFTEPQTLGEQIAAAAYRRSVQAEGKSWKAELNRLKSRDTPGNTAGDAASTRPLIVPPIRRKTKQSKTATYRREFDALPYKRQRSQGGFQNFAARREAGLVAADGTLTMRRRN